MELTIRIKCDNAAFTDDGEPADEIARILSKYADDIKNGAYLERVLIDYNGHSVGKALLA